MERTIRVTGKGKIQVKPNQIVLRLSFCEVLKTYGVAVQASTTQITRLKDILEEIGISRNEVKTNHFSINPEYKRIESNNSNFNTKLIGYRYNHDVIIRFDIDNQLLDKVLEAVSKIEQKPLINIEYSVKDCELIKNELITKAVKDSKNKAMIISQEMGVSLGNVISIDYSSMNIDLTINPYRDNVYNNMDCRMMSTCDIDPEDIEVEDEVTINWEII